jgi:hypothetical protein
MFDDRNFRSKKCRVYRPEPVTGVVDVQRIDTDEGHLLISQKASGVPGEKGMALQISVGPPVNVPAGSHQHRLARQG